MLGYSFICAYWPQFAVPKTRIRTKRVATPARTGHYGIRGYTSTSVGGRPLNGTSLLSPRWRRRREQPAEADQPSVRTDLVAPLDPSTALAGNSPATRQARHLSAAGERSAAGRHRPAGTCRLRSSGLTHSGGFALLYGGPRLAARRASPEPPSDSCELTAAPISDTAPQPGGTVGTSP